MTLQLSKLVLVNKVIMKKAIKDFWKRAMLFSFLIFMHKNYGQKFLRNSDYKEFESVIVMNNNGKKILDKNNFKKELFKDGDKVLYNNKLVDFMVSNDTLFFFDKIKEIEEVELLHVNNKAEKKVKSKKKNASAEIFANNRVATYIKIKNNKKIFIKSFTVVQKGILFPEDEFFEGILQIQILKNLNGFPDDNSELLSFEKNIPKMANKWDNSQKWEIVLPQVIKYPEDGFFIVFYIKTDKKHTIALGVNDESPMYMFYPNEGWKKLSFNSYYYQLKILQ